MRSNAGNLNRATLQVNKEQNEISHQSAQSENLHAEEIGPCQYANERRPRRRALPLRGRRYAVAPQNIADRLVRHLVPQVGQRPHDSVAEPGAAFGKRLFLRE